MPNRSYWPAACESISTMNPIIISKTCHSTPKKIAVRKFTLAAGVGLLLIAGAATSCNTVAGVGRDVERGGEKIKDAAN